MRKEQCSLLIFILLVGCGLFCLPGWLHAEKQLNTIYYVQTGAFTNSDTLITMQQELKSLGYTQQTVVSVSTIQKLWLGPISSFQEAKKTAISLRKAGYPGCYPVSSKVKESVAVKLGITIQPTIYTEMKQSVNLAGIISETQLWSDISTHWKSDTASSYHAAEKLVEFTLRFPNSSQVPVAKYKLGQIYRSLYYSLATEQSPDKGMEERYLTAAAQVLQELVSSYPQAEIAPKAFYRLGLTRIELRRFSGNYVDKLGEAAAVFKQFEQQYPHHSLAPKAHTQYCAMLFEQAVNNRLSWDTVRIELQKQHSLIRQPNPGF